MTKRKYQVFISSTFKGMEDARKAAVSGVSDTFHIPISLEKFAPENASDLEIIKREVDACQVYVLILGPYYGAIPKGNSDKSYTEIEYDLAIEAGRYVLAFTLAEVDRNQMRKELDQKTDIEEISNLKKLNKFYKRVSNGAHFHRRWSYKDIESIRRFIAIALTDLPNRVDAPKGLVPEIDFSNELIDSLTKNEFVQDTVKAMRSFDKLYKRTTTNVELKNQTSKFLIERYHAQMESKETKGIFFESGSSIAFLAKMLPENLWRRARYTDHGKPKLQIMTNNSLAFLLLWLNKGIPVAQFPKGKSDKTYGASFGPISFLGERSPSYDGSPLNKRAKAAIQSLEASRLTITRENTSLIIMATSGIQLSDEHKIISDENYVIPKNVLKNINNCYGFHVGSYHNKIFKRYLLGRKIPTIIIADADKIDSEIDIRKCHFICDNELSWDELISNQPLAFCIGCETKDLDEIHTKLNSSLPEFEFVLGDRTRPYSAIIARNSLFKTNFSEDTDLI